MISMGCTHQFQTNTRGRNQCVEGSNLGSFPNLRLWRLQFSSSLSWWLWNTPSTGDMWLRDSTFLATGLFQESKYLAAPPNSFSHRVIQAWQQQRSNFCPPWSGQKTFLDIQKAWIQYDFNEGDFRRTNKSSSYGVSNKERKKQTKSTSKVKIQHPPNFWNVLRAVKGC